MADLKHNVEVDGVWFGPDYPDAKPNAEQAKALKSEHLYADDPEAFDPEAEPVAEPLIGESKDAPAAKTAAPPKPDTKG
jgi:hypothetical protein